jgi:undecaprenyl-diphosphatase
MNYFQAFLIAIVEGLTEFLPVSSTGHMIILNSILGLNEKDNFIKLFIICIQLGAILSVVVVYHDRFAKSLDFYFKLFVAFIPAAIAGLLLKKYIDRALEDILYIAMFLFLGGIILLFVDKWFEKNELDKEEDITYFSAVKIGICQCFAMFPGVSRSAATIIGGMTQKLTRKNAAEFSFFLAVPTMFAATGKKLYDFKNEGMDLNLDQISLLVFGNVIAFVVAFLAIQFFVNLLTKKGFKIFGWYRIILGGALVIMHFLKIPMSNIK